jgi:hypothetical protein
MGRVFLYFVALSAALTVLRFAILWLAGFFQKRSLQKRLGKGADAAIETLLDDWRRKTGRALWFNLVGIPSIAVTAIILVAQYA